MDRVRAGLTGLGAVFLVTAAAALLFGPEPGDLSSFGQSKEPGEPLAQLGVAPSNEKAPAAARPPEAPPASATPSASAAPPASDAPPGSPQPQTGPAARDVPVRV